jgi:SPP1 family predicted phage head-tail adaptor
MRAGDLRHRIIIQQNTPTANAMGEYVDTWTTFAEVWAAIEPDTGNTTYAAKQLNSEASGKIRIRYLSGLEPTMRISYQDRIYSILTIIEPKLRHEDIVILYSEALD